MLTVSAIPHRAAPTPIRRHRWQRDLVMSLAARHGASPGLLAEAFDLDVSTVRKILRRRGVRPRGAHATPQA